jgi:phosphoglycolate phosphatase
MTTVPRFALAIFDLDGTLCDTRLDIAASTNHVRTSFGLEPLSTHEIERLVGHGARTLVERALGPERKSLHDEGERRLLEYYVEHCLDQTRAYDGLVELIDSLSPIGVRFAVVTNKLFHLTMKILEGLDLARRLAVVVGGDTFAERKPHPRGIEHVLDSVGAERGRALMVGDSWIDVEAARAARIAVCGVLWGFDSEGLRAASPDSLVADAASLERVIRTGSV